MQAEYHPNLNDARVLKRIAQAYGAIIATSGPTVPHFHSKFYLDKHLGQQQHPLSAWLRSTLLITVDEHYSMTEGKCKSYVYNTKGKNYIKAIIKGQTKGTKEEWENELNSKTSPLSVSLLLDEPIVLNWVRREYGPELKTLDFTYSDKSGRLWHGLQNVKTKFRREIQRESGLMYNYDISSCAPTLILQYAQQQEMDEYLFAINRYIKEKAVVRDEIAKCGNIDIRQAKVLINALFCGAKLGANTKFSLFHLLDRSYSKVKSLQENDFVKELKSDIQKCWSALESTMYITTVTSPSGKTRKKQINSKQKWAVYFKLERKVLDCVRTYLDINNIKYFLEHDGWVTDKKLDVAELQEYIRSNTSFNVKIEES